MENNNSFIFNIQKYSVHDGPGIRTIVFLKGCPLNCPWCANPEGKSFKKELHFNENLCKKCGYCTTVCPNNALSIDEEGVKIDREKCVVCGKCVSVCPEMAYKIFGEARNIDDVLKEVSRDEIFYKRSGGGLTISGGEPLSHLNYTLELLKKAKERYELHTAIETTGFASEETLRKIIKYVDFVFCDIKMLDPQRHKDILGVPVEPILRNITIIANEYKDIDIVLRLPLVPGYNDSDENIRMTAEFINGLEREVPIELLPYHMFGKSKYTGLGYEYDSGLEDVVPPENERMQELIDMFINLGVKVVNNKD